MELDDKRQSILDADGHILVLGGPGAGKTTIALLKAKALFPTLLPGQQLLFLSFSRAAVRQVLNGCQEHLTAEERHAIEVKTYHAFCMEFLQSHGKLLSGRSVSIMYPTQERLAKAQFDGDWDVERTRLADQESLYCFDLFATGVAELLERCSALRILLASCYPVVIVDEFQDTDDEQWRIVKTLASVTRVLCLADKDQRIFDYRDDIDPKRIDHLLDEIGPNIFDLGGENHRSPRGGILGFADAVLNNITPLPEVDDVKLVSCWGNAFPSTVHVAVIWTFSQLRKKGVDDPCIAVLARSNPLVSKVSNILREQHSYNGNTLPPVEHSVVWDAELSASAGSVVASIMEWSNPEAESPVADSLEAIAHYYELKNATSPSNAASENIRKFREAATKVRENATPRINAAKGLVSAFENEVEFIGDPVRDWTNARKVLDDISYLREIFREARMVRLFRATDAIGSGLADLWLQSGHYSGAQTLVSNTLEYERLVSADKEPSGCVLMSIHKSKGKEFDGVVIVEENFSGIFFDPNREPPPYERTRRLLRVAITRAKTHVTIVRPNNAIPLTQ
jgi:DNA helicase-2/ATP-dependent DNA helicase PcrA